MEGKRIIRRALHLLVFVVLISHLKLVSAKCPDKVVTCFCTGGNNVKVNVQQCLVGGTCQLCFEPDEREFCLSTHVQSQCAEDGNREITADRQFSERHVQSCSSQGINISESIPEGPPIVKGARHLEDFVDRDFTLKCLAYSRTPANITWLVNGRPVKLGGPGCERCSVSIPLNSCYQQLHIRRSETTDSGNYTCVVSNKYGTVKSTSVIKVREKHLGKIFIDKVSLRGEKEKAILGGSVDITCRIIDPSGLEVQVMWQKNGKRADDDDKRQIWIRDGTSPKERKEKILVLTLKNVTVEDEGNWTCAAIGGQPSSIQRKTFTLRTEPCPGGYYCPWRENKKYPCPYGTYTDGSSKGTVLSPTDCLKCPGVPQGTHPESTWKPAASLNGCTTGNDSHVKSCNSQGIYISDSIPEGPPVVKGARKLERFVDMEVTLVCLAYSRTSANLTWIVKGRRVKPGGPGCERCSASIPLNSCYQQLHIRRSETTDSGNYTCVVTNKYGTAQSFSSITVREKHFGKISIDEVRLEGEKQRAILGGSVDITCRIIDPSEMEVQVMWQKNGKRADDDDKRQIWIRDGTFPKEKREKVFILTLKNVTVEDEGNWTCSVKGGQPASVQRKTFILRTEPCPGGYYCPWRENKKYPCPYGTYTNGSSNGRVFSLTDCLKCPGLPQSIHPESTWKPAASLDGCTTGKPTVSGSKEMTGTGASLTVTLLASAVGLLFVLLLCVLLILWYNHKWRFYFHPNATKEWSCNNNFSQSKI